MISLQKIMKRHPSTRQLKYAYGRMNTNKSKQQVALEAGFSPSTARVPKSIENKMGFKLALAELAGEMENTEMKLMFEIQARDLSKMSNKDLTNALSTMTKVHERFVSMMS